jgi:hypothetical protein
MRVAGVPERLTTRRCAIASARKDRLDLPGEVIRLRDLTAGDRARRKAK